MSQSWQPATLEEIESLLESEVANLNGEQLALWRQCRISPRPAPIVRYGKPESVFIVAEYHGEAIYWEDVEEGFNISPLGPDGEVLEHWCNQDELRWALNRLARSRCATAASQAGATDSGEAVTACRPTRASGRHQPARLSRV